MTPSRTIRRAPSPAPLPLSSNGGLNWNPWVRAAGFLIPLLVAATADWASLFAVVHLCLSDERYSHIAVIPFISACLIYFERITIFERSRLFPAMGLPLVVLELISFHPAIRSSLPLSVSVFVLIVTVAFAFCYGKGALRGAIFPLCLLLLTIPVPAGVLDQAVFVLQKGTTEVTYRLLTMAGVPVFRKGFELSLPGVNIEIAEQCSGIRSSIALFLTALLSGHLLLRSGWSTLSLALFAIPVSIFKNALRVATLSCLGAYVDAAFFYGRLHRYGGLVFSPLGIALLLPMLLAFRKLETRRARGRTLPVSRGTGVGVAAEG